MSASGEAGAFDRNAVDCPFVFRSGDRYYMTYIGFDVHGLSDRAGFVDDLVEWKREGCILKRDPKSEITRYNSGLNWILRENDVRSQGRLKKVKGRYLGCIMPTRARATNRGRR